MNSAMIVQQAALDGVTIVLGSTGALKANGDEVAVSRWLPKIRANKRDIMAFLRRAVNLITPEDETAICAWLAHIEESDPGIISEVLNKCRAEPKARDYFLWRACEVPCSKRTGGRDTCPGG